MNDRARHIEIDWKVLGPVLRGSGFERAVYESKETVVVLGRSIDTREIDQDACRRDGVPVVRRAGGGGAVVLSRGVVVISAAGITSLPYQLREHMNGINRVLIAILEELGVQALSIRGISDIALGDRKILGSSLYRKRDVVLYQGSLLVDPDFSLMDRYLRHPRREPDYRRGRSHRDFVTSLREAGFPLSLETVVEGIDRELGRRGSWTATGPAP
jgi:lipoate-protein ligase A